MTANIGYRTYLHLALNKMYSESANQACVMIPCGGPTNLEPPFQGTEAEAMASYLAQMIDRPELQKATQLWKIALEDQSLSTLENLLFAKRLIDQQSMEGSITIFCEETRKERLRETAERVFKKDVRIESIDFDVSKNRYLDPTTIRSKEQDALKETIWTLDQEDRLVQHHELFVRKFAFFREERAKGLSHVDVVEKWYKEMPAIMKEIMPEHPFFQQESNK